MTTNTQNTDAVYDVMKRLCDARRKIDEASHTLKSGSRNSRALLEASDIITNCIYDIGDIMDPLDNEEPLWPLLKRRLGEISEKSRADCGRKMTSLRTKIKEWWFADGS